MKSLMIDGIEDYAFQHTRPEPELLQSLAARTQREMEFPQMLTGRLEGRLLKMLVRMLQPRLIIEVGTFTGYSALSMAEGLPEGGRIITCDVNPVAAAVAQQAFDASPYGKRISLRLAPALETIAALTEPVDFSFIDADKLNYPNYYEMLVQKTRPGGVIALDNMLWSGEVLDPKDEQSQVLARLNETIARDERVENVLLTVRDGVQLVFKR